MTISTLKIMSVNAILLCSLLILVLSSCEKAADPTVVKVSSTPITGGSTTGGGTTGGGTTGGGTTGDTGSTGSTGSISATGSINVNIAGITSVISPPVSPAYFDQILNAATNTNQTLISADVLSTTRSFNLVTEGKSTGQYPVNALSVIINSKAYLVASGFPGSGGTVTFTKYDFDNSTKKGTLEGTFDVNALNFDTAAQTHITGSISLKQ